METTHETHPFLSDMQTLRARAREAMDQGAVVGDSVDSESMLALLDALLATEIVCTLRYKALAYAAEGVLAEVVKAEFEEHAAEEQSHQDMLAERITQLGGVPNLDPTTAVERGHATYGTVGDLRSMMEEDLLAERIAIQTYREAIQGIGDSVPTTRRILETILAQEEEHADDLAGLLNDPRLKDDGAAHAAGR